MQKSLSVAPLKEFILVFGEMTNLILKMIKFGREIGALSWTQA